MPATAKRLLANRKLVLKEIDLIVSNQKVKRK